MRDKERIDLFLNKLSELWQKIPDLRFAQVYTVLSLQASEKFGKDIFYMEEEDVIELIQDILDNGEYS